MVVAIGQGQSSTTAWPTTNFRQTKASVAVVDPLPLASQMHDGSHTALPMEARKIKRQSVAVGAAPLLTAWAQSPLAAIAGAALNTSKLVSAQTMMWEIQARQPNSTGKRKASRLAMLQE